MWTLCDFQVNESYFFSASASNQSVLTVIDLGARHKLENCTTDGFCDVVPGACVTLHSQTSSLPNVK